MEKDCHCLPEFFWGERQQEWIETRRSAGDDSFRARGEKCRFLNFFLESFDLFYFFRLYNVFFSSKSKTWWLNAHTHTYLKWLLQPQIVTTFLCVVRIQDILVLQISSIQHTVNSYNHHAVH